MRRHLEMVIVAAAGLAGGGIAIGLTVDEPLGQSEATVAVAITVAGLLAIIGLSIAERVSGWLEERRVQAEREEHAAADAAHFAHLIRLVEDLDDVDDPEAFWKAAAAW